MKKIHLTAIAAAVLLAAPLARAWTYTDGNTLLIFRATGFNTVEFNLGDISQFTNVPAGTTIPVTGWSSSLVTGTFGNDLTGVSVIVLATKSPYGNSKASWGQRPECRRERQRTLNFLRLAVQILEYHQLGRHQTDSEHSHTHSAQCVFNRSFERLRPRGFV